MIKHIIVIVLSGLLFFGLHSVVLVQFFDVGTTDSIVYQHLFLIAIILFTYIATHIASRIIPAQTGFVFIGLLMAKMIVTSIFVYQQGWLEDNGTLVQRGVFLCFYFTYLVCLLLVTVKIINRIHS